MQLDVAGPPSVLGLNSAPEHVRGTPSPLSAHGRVGGLRALAVAHNAARNEGVDISLGS